MEESRQSKLREILREVKDPELPSIDIVELGIFRRLSETPDGLVVEITPTYSGCPALDIIQADIRSTLERHQLRLARIDIVLSPPWTTDWLSDETKQKLRAAAISPPRSDLVNIGDITHPPRIACPHCGSFSTKVESEFGSTACKALCSCQECLQPFEYLKSI